MLPTSCSGVNHCGNIRLCDRCAKARQRKIADAAEILEQQYGQLSLTVITPDINTQDEIKRLRASFLRRTVSPSGIWTIETGEKFNGLHLNILSPKPAPARWRSATTYSELVRYTTREAAAYISKRSGMPPIEQFIGNLYGTFGQLYNYLTDNKICPTVQAAAIEVSLSQPPKTLNTTEEEPMKSTPCNDPENWVKRNDLTNPNKPMSYYPFEPEKSNPPYHRKMKTKEERAEIMRRHLPNIYAAISKPTPEDTTAQRKK
jgi:hypothetical protein